jgi:hypothetical protein
MNSQLRASQLVVGGVVALVSGRVPEPVRPEQRVLVDMEWLGSEAELYGFRLGLLQQFLTSQTGVASFQVRPATVAPRFELRPVTDDPHFSDKLCLPELRLMMQESGIRHLRSQGVIVAVL